MISFVYIFIYVFLALVCLNKLRDKFGEFSKIPKDHVKNSKVTTSHPSSFPFSHDSQLQVIAFYLCKYLVIMFMYFP